LKKNTQKRYATEQIDAVFSNLQPNQFVRWAVHIKKIHTLKKGSVKSLSNVINSFQEQYEKQDDIYVLSLVSQGSSKSKGEIVANRPTTTARQAYIQSELVEALDRQDFQVIDVHHGKDGSRSKTYKPSFLGIQGTIKSALLRLAEVSTARTYRIDIFLQKKIK